MKRLFFVAIAILVLSVSAPAAAQETVKIGLNYPRTGPYFTQGLDQFRAAEIAQDEINAAGGILAARRSKSSGGTRNRGSTSRRGT